MKIKVQFEDGTIQTLTLKGNIKLLEGEHLDLLACEDGTEHFFTKDGYYDGWGAEVPESEDIEGRLDIEGEEPCGPGLN